MPKRPSPVTPFHKTAAVTAMAATALGIVHGPLAWIPLVLFLMLCTGASFCHRCSFYVPVISRGATNCAAVALTFDDGPDPATTPQLLDILEDNGVPATFFVTGERARAYPELIRAIADAGHTLGNHSFSHSTLIAFRGRKRVFDDIAATQSELSRLGIVPRVFRPPVGITYPHLAPVLAALGLSAVGFSCRARDFGNRAIRHLSRRILACAMPGDVIMLHDLPPYHVDQMAAWLVEIEALVKGLKAKKLPIRPLAELIGKAVDNRQTIAER
ncbi:hypothetical protein DSCO28_21860 [Desulfosarcina ovata subsp. sediminis]|uniref:NodB homology domain-containing protein n=1 Tax=Desulfosarcina ovata subsp. sediminis TaxID=885957 RepID=A0A5K7ZQ91_9BACT|nr:polysaccharide deacetylase family protein [Desulfosarcina ovata]BBO81620.1 hypothetical protein DSCO28_21860 [Desulfosarcina ovata subsp. sediminis]